MGRLHLSVSGSLGPQDDKCIEPAPLFWNFHRTKSACYAGRGKLQKFKLMESVMTTKQPIKIFSRLSFWSVAIGSMAILAACGGDSGSGVKDPEIAEGDDRDLVVETFDDLPVCSSKREGLTAYVKDEKTAYMCVDGDWTVDGTPSSSATTEEQSSDEAGISSSSFVYVQSSGAYELPEMVTVKD